MIQRESRPDDFEAAVVGKSLPGRISVDDHSAAERHVDETEWRCAVNDLTWAERAPSDEPHTYGDIHSPAPLASANAELSPRTSGGHRGVVRADESPCNPSADPSADPSARGCELREQARRRDDAASRMPPLASGVRDPDRMRLR